MGEGMGEGMNGWERRAGGWRYPARAWRGGAPLGLLALMLAGCGATLQEVPVRYAMEPPPREAPSQGDPHPSVTPPAGPAESRETAPGEASAGTGESAAGRAESPEEGGWWRITRVVLTPLQDAAGWVARESRELLGGADAPPAVQVAGASAPGGVDAHTAPADPMSPIAPLENPPLLAETLPPPAAASRPAAVEAAPVADPLAPSPGGRRAAPPAAAETPPAAAPQVTVRVTPPAGERAPTPVLVRYYIRMGSFAQFANGEALEQRLIALGVPANGELVTVSGTRYYRVSAGPFPSVAEARQAQLLLQKNHLEPGGLVPRERHSAP